MKFEYEKLGKPMPDSEIAEEVATTDDSEPTEAPETASEAETVQTEDISDESAEEEE